MKQIKLFSVRDEDDINEFLRKYKDCIVDVKLSDKNVMVIYTTAATSTRLLEDLDSLGGIR